MMEGSLKSLVPSTIVKRVRMADRTSFSSVAPMLYTFIVKNVGPRSIATETLVGCFESHLVGCPLLCFGHFLETAIYGFFSNVDLGCYQSAQTSVREYSSS